MLRVLCFCGFTSNQFLFGSELSRLQKECGDTVDFVILQPPRLVEPSDLPSASPFTARKSTGWEDGALTEEYAPRAWYDGGSNWRGHGGFGEALTYVHDFLIANEPFDGFLAFSSGVVLAIVVAAMLERPTHGDPDFLPHPSLRPLKFFVSCSGFVPSGRHRPNPKYTHLFPLTGTTAILHIIGRNDTILASEESLHLAELCPNRRVEWHEGGHFVPMKPSWRGFFKAWITSFSPGGSNGHGIPPVNDFAPAVIGKRHAARLAETEIEEVDKSPLSRPRTTALEDIVQVRLYMHPTETDKSLVYAYASAGKN